MDFVSTIVWSELCTPAPDEVGGGARDGDSLDERQVGGGGCNLGAIVNVCEKCGAFNQEGDGLGEPDQTVSEVGHGAVELGGGVGDLGHGCNDGGAVGKDGGGQEGDGEDEKRMLTVVAVVG